MDFSTEQLAALLDREGIRDCVARLARGEDRRNAERIVACFWSDATIDLGIFAGNLDEYLDWVVPGSPAVQVTQHVLGQSVIEIEHDGDTARVETHVTSYHRLAQDVGDRDTVIGGRYLDRLNKRSGRWRITHRMMLYDWYHDLGQSIDWSQGLIGLPLRADYYVGKAVGDHSEVFFGDGGEWAR